VLERYQASIAQSWAGGSEQQPAVKNMSQSSKGSAQWSKADEALLKNHKEDDLLKEKDDTNWPPLMAGERIGDMIDRYKILEEIGEGGFGMVYRVEQEGPLQLQFALKVIKPGMDTRQILKRFEAERKTLAKLNHTNIAKVVDAGATHNGRPYFVMEWVRGIKIDEYANSKKLTFEKRLRLFAKVCRAIQHAHEKQVVHRDIKPSNLLVIEEDGEEVPKVIDFGIAKAIEGEHSAGHTVFTSPGQLIGTPAFMSPEQAQPGKVSIDHRTDIYSLGVLLQELITGHLPFDFVGKSSHEQIQEIIEKKPARASEFYRALQASEQLKIAYNCQSTPDELNNFIVKNLDQMIERCLKKKREERYSTVKELSDAINSILESLKIQNNHEANQFENSIKQNRAVPPKLLLEGVSNARRRVKMPNKFLFVIFHGHLENLVLKRPAKVIKLILIAMRICVIVCGIMTLVNFFSMSEKNILTTIILFLLTLFLGSAQFIFTIKHKISGNHLKEQAFQKSFLRSALFAVLGMSIMSLSVLLLGLLIDARDMPGR